MALLRHGLRSGWGGVLGGVLGGAVSGYLVGVGSDGGGEGPSDLLTRQGEAEAGPSSPPGGEPFLRPSFIADAAERVAPSVVNVQLAQEGRGLGRLFAGVSGGSGFIIDGGGTILTNNHVVEGANARGVRGGKITVTMRDGRQFEAQLQHADPASDLAILKVESDEPLPAAPLGGSADLRPGDFVVAIGSPLSLHNSVTAGIVSSTHRQGSELGVRGARTDYIQTDAAINGGNSGGPLVDLQGQVVAINTMKAQFADGVGFAIPIDEAKQVVADLQAYGMVRRPYLGLKLLWLTPDMARHFRKRDLDGFPADVESGALIAQVARGSPAERAGLEAGDVVTAIEGRPVKKSGDLLQAIGPEVGKPVRLEVNRRGRPRQVTVVTEQAGGAL